MAKSGIFLNGRHLLEHDLSKLDGIQRARATVETLRREPKEDREATGIALGIFGQAAFEAPTQR